VECSGGDLAAGRRRPRGGVEDCRGSLSWVTVCLSLIVEISRRGLGKSYIIKSIWNVNFSIVDGPDPPDLTVWVVLY
jgi:hypothetical protein